MNNLIEIDNVCKNYNSKEGEICAVKNISLNIKQGEILSIVGPSGCGKSTLLSLISKLDKNYSGNIKYNDDLKIGYMLQNDALLPWLTIYENCLLGLKINRDLTENNIKFVEYLLKLYNLEEFKEKYPKSLSGGMRQRVALIRTLSTNPEVLLLDEPFSALDAQTRLAIGKDVYDIVRSLNKTVILVTHNIEEAIMFSDRVVVLSRRPSIIKNIIDIDISKDSFYERRNHQNYNKYFNMIWKDLDNNE